MDEMTERLRACFRTVFEDLPEDQIDSVTQAGLEEWDSLAMLTLITVVEEEFELFLDDDAAAELGSFAAFRNAVERSQAA